MKALADARIAIVTSALQPKPEQEKYWPAIEDAIRARAEARQQRMAALDEVENQKDVDPFKLLSMRADPLAQKGAALKKLADAWKPLYATLDADHPSSPDKDALLLDLAWGCVHQAPTKQARSETSIRHFALQKIGIIRCNGFDRPMLACWALKRSGWQPRSSPSSCCRNPVPQAGACSRAVGSGVFVHELHEALSLGRGEVHVIGDAFWPVMPMVNRPVPALKTGWPSASALTELDRVSFAMVNAVTRLTEK